MLSFGKIWVSVGAVIHTASYPMDTRDSYPGGRTAGAWGWPLTSIVPRSRMCGTIPSFPQFVLMAWRLVKHWGNFILPAVMESNSQFPLAW